MSSWNHHIFCLTINQSINWLICLLLQLYWILSCVSRTFQSVYCLLSKSWTLALSRFFLASNFSCQTILFICVTIWSCWICYVFVCWLLTWNSFFYSSGNLTTIILCFHSTIFSDALLLKYYLHQIYDITFFVRSECEEISLNRNIMWPYLSKEICRHWLFW